METMFYEYLAAVIEFLIVVSMICTPLVIIFWIGEKVEEKTGWLSKMSDYLFTEE